MKIQKCVLSFSIVVVSIHVMITLCSGEEFPWPMFMGALSQGCKNGCNDVLNEADTVDAAGTYEGRVADFKARYGKNDEWEIWMIANKVRYESAFVVSKELPGTISISFRYETTAINYSPAWASEAEHMNVFTTMAEGTYPGYSFEIVFNGDTSTSYANVIAGTAGTTSYSYGKDIYLYYETIFNHEFAHTMKLLHHYDSMDDVGNGLHMPPGETQCIMDRTSALLCSACRTAIGLPLDVSSTDAMDAAMNDILSRYPY